MRNTVVVGLGNRLLTDDGIGVSIVEKLMELNVHDYVDYIIGETDIEYCLSETIKANYIILIDAAEVGNIPGDITVIQLDEIIPKSPGFFSHDLSLFTVLSYYKKDIKGIFIGIKPHKIDYGFGLSPVLENKFMEIIKAIQGIIAQKAQI